MNLTTCDHVYTITEAVKDLGLEFIIGMVICFMIYIISKNLG